MLLTLFYRWARRVKPYRLSAAVVRSCSVVTQVRPLSRPLVAVAKSIHIVVGVVRV
jgi:hypothetical protein